MTGIEGHLGDNVETSAVETPWNLQDWPYQRLLVMGDMDPEPAIFSNQARFLKAELAPKPRHKTFNLQSVLPPRCVRVMVTQNFWVWLTNDWSNLRSTPREEVHTDTA